MKDSDINVKNFKLIKARAGIGALVTALALCLVGVIVASRLYLTVSNTNQHLTSQVASLSQGNQDLENQLSSISAELTSLKSQDQYKINKDLQAKIQNIETTYKSAVNVYSQILDLAGTVKDLSQYETLFAKALSQLSSGNYSSASATLTALTSQIQAVQQTAAAAPIPSNVPANNAPPASGFSRQRVHIDSGDFLVDIISADLGSTKVTVDTASDSDCGNNCPVLPLATYVARSGAYAGVNGTYFCPASYPQCAGKTNTFDLLVMNKNKHYFNSGNNVYSTNPAAIFSAGNARFVQQALEWGRDTGVDSVISNFPLLVFNGSVVFGGNGDPKMTSATSRGFIAGKGSTVYIGIVHGATVADSAKVLAALGVTNALNLDDGGSAALWFGGYQDGPGRDLANAVLFVKR